MTFTAIVVALIMLLIGFLLGWFVEWRIDLAYWRSYFEEPAGGPPPQGEQFVLSGGENQPQLPAANQALLVTALKDQVAQRDADLTALRAMIEQLGATESHRREQEASLMDEARRLREQLDELSAAKNDAEVEWRYELSRREQQWQDSKEAEFTQLQTEIGRLRQSLTEAEARHASYRASHPTGLVEIRGIGPKLESELRRLGIQSFDQLAARTPDELQTLLNPPKWQKLDFESWIEQARILAQNQA